VTNVDVTNIPTDEQLGVFASNVTTFLTDLDIDQYQTSAETAAQAALAKASWDSIVPCDHAAMGDSACATQIIQTFGQGRQASSRSRWCDGTVFTRTVKADQTVSTTGTRCPSSIRSSKRCTPPRSAGAAFRNRFPQSVLPSRVSETLQAAP
jgi:hypothetical protein